jgi:hypothetical protein
MRSNTGLYSSRDEAVGQTCFCLLEFRIYLGELNVTISSGQGPIAGSCEYDNEHPHSFKGREFIDQLGEYQLLKKGSAPRSQLGGRETKNFHVTHVKRANVQRR